jgi:L-threonylcarbamoyladenylate synthase
MVDFETDIKNCMAMLESGGTILYPTDTVWGIGCNALDHVAANRVFAIKDRPAHKSMIVLLADARDVLRYVAAPPPDIIAIIEGFSTPTTVIYDGALDFAENIINHDGSIAIRVTTDPFCKALIKRLRKPIVSTSANISGSPTPATYMQVPIAIREQVGYIVKYRQDDTLVAKPSRLIKINPDGSLQIIRG